MMAIEPIKYLIDLIYSSKIVNVCVLPITRKNHICSLTPFILPGSALDTLRSAEKQTPSPALYKACGLVWAGQTLSKRQEETKLEGSMCSVDQRAQGIG